MLFNNFKQTYHYQSNYIIADLIRFTIFTLLVLFLKNNEIILFIILLFITIIFNIGTLILKPYDKSIILMEALIIEIVATFSLLASLFYTVVENTTTGKTRLLFGLFI